MFLWNIVLEKAHDLLFLKMIIFIGNGRFTSYVWLIMQFTIADYLNGFN